MYVRRKHRKLKHHPSFEDDFEILEAAAQRSSKMANCRQGPCTASELWSWPRNLVSCMSAEEGDRVDALLSEGSQHTTDYSGFDCPRSMMATITKALCERSPKLNAAEHKFIRSCDNNALAQSILCSYAQDLDSDTTCVFGGLESSMDQEHKDMLDSLEPSKSLRKMKDPEAVAECVTAYENLTQHVWSEKEVHYPRHAVSPCLVHGGAGCPLFKQRFSPLSLSFNWAGTICKGWSTVGAQQRFGDPSERPHASWVAQRHQAAKFNTEDLFMQECTKNYPWILKLVLPLRDTHHIVSVMSDPRKVFGFPSKRPRRYSAGLALERPCE